MSHRVNVKTKIDDREALEDALQELKWDFKAEGDIITIPHLTAYGITATINTATGDVEVDSMKERDIERLRQQVNVAKINRDTLRRGGSVLSQEQLSDGTIRIKVKTYG